MRRTVDQPTILFASFGLIVYLDNASRDDGHPAHGGLRRKAKTMAKFTITLEDTIRVPLGDTGRFTEVPVGKLPESAIRFAAINGLVGALNNVSRGKDENDKPNSDDVWAAMREKRVAPWLQGQWGSVTRESSIAPMREAYVDETRARTRQSVTGVERDMTTLVRATFGEKEKATFGKFLDALATAIAKERKLEMPDVREKLDAKYARLAREAAEARKAAADSVKLDLSSIDLD